MSKFNRGDRVMHYRYGLATIKRIEYKDRLQEQWYLVKFDKSISNMPEDDMWSSLESSLTFVGRETKRISLSVCKL